MRVFASTSVEAGDEIELAGDRWRDSVAIVVGDLVTLDFYDPVGLDRLAALAAEGARLLRVKRAESESADAEDDRPVEPAAP